MYRYLIIIVLTSLLTIGCESGGTRVPSNAELERIANMHNIELAESAGEPVLLIGGESVTADDIIETPVELGGQSISPMEYFSPIARLTNLEQFKQQSQEALKVILTNSISDIVLYQYARKQFGQNNEESLEKAAQAELRKFQLSYGGDQARADEALRQMDLDRTSFIELQKRTLLIQWYVSTELRDERPITYRELQEQYEKMKDESFAREAIIQFSLIDIQPAKLAQAEPNENTTELAKKLATELLAKIEAGEDFGELAKQYSHGHMSEFGGLWRPVSPNSLAPPYDWIADAAQETEPGRIAGLRITPEHVFIMKLEKKQTAGYEPFEKVQKQVRDEVLISRRSTVIDKLNTRIVQQAELGQTDEFIDFCLEKIHRTSTQQD